MRTENDSRACGLMCLDPVFFLHHAQVDRLWWSWQQRDLQTRLSLYEALEGDPAVALTDLLEMRGLTDNLAVQEVMDAAGGRLCYQYD